MSETTSSIQEVQPLKSRLQKKVPNIEDEFKSIEYQTKFKAASEQCAEDNESFDEQLRTIKKRTSTFFQNKLQESDENGNNKLNVKLLKIDCNKSISSIKSKYQSKKISQLSFENNKNFQNNNQNQEKQCNENICISLCSKVQKESTFGSTLEDDFSTPNCDSSKLCFKTQQYLLEESKQPQPPKQTQLELQQQYINYETFNKMSSDNEDVELSDEENINEILSAQFQEKYQILQILGNGIQATVALVKDKASNTIHAAKTFRYMDEELSSQIQNEFQIMKELNHSGILKVHELIDINSKPTIIMEYFQSNTLNDIGIHQLTTNEICNIIYKLLDIVSYIHQKEVMHRDIQLRNILYNQKTQQIKLIDFGLAKQFIKNQLNFSKCGYQHYQPPEMLSGDQYSNKVDIWQIGQIFYEMMEKKRTSSRLLCNLIKKQKLQFQNTSSDLQTIILSLLNIQSSQRIEAAVAKELLKPILQQSLLI